MISIVDVGLVVPWVLVGGQSWLLYRVLSGHRSLLLSQEQLRSQLHDIEHALMSPPSQTAAQEAPSALEIGTPAPDFALVDLSGRERRLQEFLGRPLVVNFFSPSCGFCVDMAPRLGQLPESGPRMLVISRGDSDENLRLARDHKWRCDVVLDPTGQVIQAYRVTGTPSGYLLTADGHVASELAVGAEALLGLVATGANGQHGLTAESLREKQQAALEQAHNAGLSLTESRLNRQGLEPGVKAPGFVLSDLDGKKQRLESFLDKRVLLVFSDPNCGPCDALAPQLVQLHDQRRDDNLHVVMISRGDLEQNRQKAQKHRFQFPVLLQKHWEVSKDYAMFATPIAYLIDPSGVVAKPVAVGPKSILELIEPS